MNNSSSQGQLFYSFIGQGSNGPLDIFPVTNCFDSEGVTGTSGQPSQVPFLGNESGLTAIENDMLQGTSETGSIKCTLSQGHD